MNGGSSIGSVKIRKNPINIDRSIRDFFKRTNLDIAFIGLVFAGIRIMSKQPMHSMEEVQDDVAKEVSSMMWHTAILRNNCCPLQ
jgi:hypothetical protein